MSDAIAREEKRRLRGTVLRALAVVYGRPSEFVSLRTLAQVAGTTTAAVTEELTFLSELQYVKQAPARDALDTFAPGLWRVTAQGMRLVNGEATDVSVEF